VCGGQGDEEQSKVRSTGNYSRISYLLLTTAKKNGDMGLDRMEGEGM
jgi:hypothetical protein